MKTVHQIPELRSFWADARLQNRTIGLIPTMGALHRGHLSLAERSHDENDLTVLTIFVNPTQFGLHEDLENYPRTLTSDQALAEKAGVDLIFAPEAQTIYPDGFSTHVEETELSRPLCGVNRPGHFRGVCTVVLKLFALAPADRAYFGQKDAQQLRVIEKMVEDLNVPISIVACPTVREEDGLAMSSRNVHLTAEERSVAPQLYAALRASETAFQEGERSASKLVKIAKEQLSSTSLFRVEYLELRRWQDLQPTEQVREQALLAVAAHLGRTRLIDNVFLKP